MTEGSLLLAAQDMSVGELVQFLVFGLVVVLTTLSILALFCIAMGAIFTASARRTKDVTPAKGRETAQGELPDELVAVISAAVATAIDQPHRIAHIGPPTDEAWAFERRMQHHTSHSVHHRKP